MPVTFLGVAIKDYTVWENWQPDRARDVLSRTDALFRAFVRLRGGETVDCEAGVPERWARFRESRDAIEAASLIREALLEQMGQASPQPLIGMAVHSGAPSSLGNIAEEGVRERCAALLAAATDWQVLLSEQAVSLTPDFRSRVESLGQHLLADLQRSMEVYQLGGSGRILSLTLLPNNLPVQLTSFIGRKQELADIHRFLARTQLLTLCGPGGCGKTRLALHAAAGLVPQYPDGVWLVDLTALRDGVLIPQAVAESLSLGLDPTRPLPEALAQQLQTKRLLLLLDNCEHMAEACSAFIADVLRKCPHLRILATSREVLHVPGETEWCVPPLFQNDAIRLFVDRAHSRLPAWRLGTENAQLLGQICQGLDGLPLAIELLVAALKVMTMDQIAGQLGRVLTLLGNGYGAANRHKSMRAALDWSHDLLSESEKKLLRRLSVFVGGATLEAISDVCSGTGVTEGRIPELLILLSDKSLLDATANAGEVRYSLKEVIRQYAAEKLQAAGEEAVLGQRHRDWALAFAEAADSKLTGQEESAWLQRIDKEYSNLHSALAWTRNAGDSAALLRLTVALSGFWYQRGYLQEGRTWFQTALDVNREPSSARAYALRGIGRLAVGQGDFEAAISCLGESLDLYRRLGDVQGEGVVLNSLGAIASLQGDFDAARTHLEAALDIQRHQGNQRNVANVLNNLGGCAMGQGDFQRASALLSEAVQIWRTLGDRFKMVDSLDNLGVIARVQGELMKASNLLHEALALRTELGDKGGIPMTMVEIAGVLSLQGRYAEARAMAEECVALHRTVGNRLWEAITLLYLGRMERLEGQFGTADRLLHESLAIFRELNERSQLGVCLYELGHLARYEKAYLRAGDLYRQSLNTFQEIKAQMGTGDALNGLSALAGDQGDYNQAITLSKQSLALFWEIRAYPSIAETLEAMASIYRPLGSLELAAQLSGGAEALRVSMGTPVPPVSKSAVDGHMTDLRMSMGPRAFETARQAGAALTIQDLVHRGLEAKPPGTPSHKAVTQAKLTGREIEVIRLVAKGLRDADIAKELVISPRTVEVHVRNMFEKVGVANRAALVSWALQKGNITLAD